MPIPRIAIVGRPNVGKSSLANMLAGAKVSITDDTPGTTRDRVSTLVTLRAEFDAKPPIQVELTDTGGYGVYTRAGGRYDDAGKDLAPLAHDIESQIAKAVGNADLILFVIDAQAGVTPLDETVAKLLREGGLAAIESNAEREAKGESNGAKGGKATKGVKKPKTPARDQQAKPGVIIVANKADGPKWESHAYDAAALGFGEPLIVSAKNNYRRREFTERLHEHASAIVERDKAAAGDAPRADEHAPEMKLAIVGKRNAGKSTLVNTLAGEERVIVSEIAGTTRDAIDVRFTMDGRSFLAIDTAGLRRKKSFDQRIEWWALERMERAIDRCDVALLLIDATEPISQVDQHVGQMLEDRFRPVIIVVNKWDLAEGRPAAGSKKTRPVTTDDYEEYLRKELRGLWYAPIAFMSAKKNTNVREVIELAFEMMTQARSRVGTGPLNRALREVIERQGPSSKSGVFAKVYYTAQIEIDPPTLVLVVNKPDLFTPQYRRFLLNRLREETPFGEVPIKLIIKGRAKRETTGGREEIERMVNQAAQLEAEQRAKGMGGSRVGAPGGFDVDTYFDEPAMLASDDAPALKPKIGKRTQEEIEEVVAGLESGFGEGGSMGAKQPTIRRRKPAAARVGKTARPKAKETHARSRKRNKGFRKN